LNSFSSELEIEKTTLIFGLSLLVNANQALGFMFSTLSSVPGVLGVLLQVRTLFFFSQILIESNFLTTKKLHSTLPGHNQG
jgi:hypothetical protein